MLPELRHVKELTGTTLPTGWSMKHATTRANVRITTVFMTAITTHLKKCWKKEKNFFRVKYQNVGIFWIGRNVQKQRLTGAH